MTQSANRLEQARQSLEKEALDFARMSLHGEMISDDGVVVKYGAYDSVDMTKQLLTNLALAAEELLKEIGRTQLPPRSRP